jgi:hypothetical protein
MCSPEWGQARLSDANLRQQLRISMLHHRRSAAAEAKENALLVYIQQQLEYAKMWKLLEFSQARLAFIFSTSHPFTVPYDFRLMVCTVCTADNCSKPHTAISSTPLSPEPFPCVQPSFACAMPIAPTFTLSV